jgi:hypothetical protein
VGAKIRCPGCQQVYRYEDEAPAFEPAPAPPRAPEILAEPRAEAPAKSATLDETAAVFASLNTAPVVAPIQQHVQVNIMEPQKGNALAIASLVLGILAALVCWVPFVGLTAIPVGLVGLLLGAIALTLVVVARRRGLAAATVGCGLSLIAMILSVVITGTTSHKLAEALKDSAKPEPVAQAVPERPRPQAAAPAQPPQPKAPPAPASAPEPESEAVAYPGPARLEHVEVMVTRVVRGKVPLRDPNPFPGEDGRGQSQDALLSVYLEVRNLDDGKKID